MNSFLTRRQKSGYRIGVRYQRLLKRYPLLPIKTRDDYARASTVLQELFGRDDLDADESGYVETLSLLVEAYEDAHENLDTLAENISPLDALKSILDSHGMKSKDLGEIIGSESAA